MSNLFLKQTKDLKREFDRLKRGPNGEISIFDGGLWTKLRKNKILLD